MSGKKLYHQRQNWEARLILQSGIYIPFDQYFGRHGLPSSGSYIEKVKSALLLLSYIFTYSYLLLIIRFFIRIRSFFFVSWYLLKRLNLSPEVWGKKFFLQQITHTPRPPPPSMSNGRPLLGVRPFLFLLQTRTSSLKSEYARSKATLFLLFLCSSVPSLPNVSVKSKLQHPPRA